MSGNGIVPSFGQIASFSKRKFHHFLGMFFWNFLYCMGRIIECMGNRVSYHGLIFDVSNPSIITNLKFRFLLGVYERAEIRMIKRHLPRALPVIELGGCIGTTACVTNHLLNHPFRHVVVEANPYLISSLERNRELNHCHFQIVHAAIAYRGDEVQFSRGIDFTGGSVQLKTEPFVTVKTVSLEELAERFSFRQFVLICDIEGGEAELIANELDFIKNHIPIIFMEIRERVIGADAVRQLFSSLHAARFVEIDALSDRLSLQDCHVFRNLDAVKNR